MRTVSQIQANPIWARITKIVHTTRPQMLHVESHGAQEQTLVFIPGLSGTTSYWRGQLGSPGRKLSHGSGRPAGVRRLT